MKWEISQPAYLVAALHFAKYGDSDVVFGLLLGKGNQVIEAVPLTHSFVLAPSLITGLALSGEYAKKQGYDIVGVYSKTLHALKYGLSIIAPKLKNEALGLLFSPKQLEQDRCMFAGMNDKEAELEIKCGLAHDELKTLVNGDAYSKLTDLDDHFSDPSQDFLGNLALVCK